MSALKQTALRISRETFAAIDIPSTIERKLARSGSVLQVNYSPLDLAAFDRIFVIAAGKASVGMVRGITNTLSPDFCATGIVVAPVLPRELIPGFRMIAGGHPLPNEGSLAAGRAILDLLSGTGPHDLIFFLLSGGGSALVEAPLDPRMTLEEIRELNRSLVLCGASIEEINAVRKHFSAVKGGRMAVAASAAMKATLAITDVPDGQESALASGPTLPDVSTVRDACGVAARYDLLPRLPARIRAQFEDPALMEETPKAGHPAFARSAFQIVLGRDDLFHPAHRAAEASQFLAVCDNSTDNWPLSRAADFLLEQLAALKRANPGRHVALIADGEVSSPVTGNGVGGRNSAFVLDCVEKIAGRPIAVLSVGTDGVDGSSPAAGAVADGETLARARALGLDPADYFRRSDSYTFFDRMGDAVVTGPTGNNLRDLRILLME